jgi:probable HAF family extracellular repeat protein
VAAALWSLWPADETAACKGDRTMRASSLWKSLVPVTAVTLWGVSGLTAAPSFMGLGDLPGGTFASSATAISADGTTVVGSSQSANGTEAFRWTAAGGMIGLGSLPGSNPYSEAYAVSAAGSVVVGRSTAPLGTNAFRWENGVMTGLGDLPGGDNISAAYGVSGDGSVVVGRGQTEYTDEAFRWENGVMTPLSDIGGPTDSVAYAISTDGSTIVGHSRGDAFRWEAGVTTMLPDVPGGLEGGAAYAVSADGSVVAGGSRTEFGQHPARWTSAGVVALGVPSGANKSWAVDMSADGSLIAIWGDVIGGSGAYLWDPAHGIRLLSDVLTNDYGLDLTGWTLRDVDGISADGLTLVGAGTNPSGHTEAWIAHIPEPATASLFVLAALLFRRRRTAWRARGGRTATSNSWGDGRKAVPGGGKVSLNLTARDEARVAKPGAILLTDLRHYRPWTRRPVPAAL